ncbi:MAG: NAD(P)/FAD-dependent oxidoreductase, partial [Bdellovibrionales bacterium]|nr:NAD(P)/FAD-dependent oxidoreductase [Bdellovibrionales bacterium]
MKHVIIVGAGFAGQNAAKKIGKDKSLKVTVLDRRNYHLFQPLLYQVATAGLSPAEIATPIRSVLSSYPNIEVQYGNVKSVDIKTKEIETDSSRLKFDFLVMACGAKHSYFNHPEWEEYAPGLKTLEQATEIRRRILLAFELAERETDPLKQKQLLTFAIVGGGPTGVELAGAIGEISRFTLSKDFKKIDPSRTRVILIEAGNRILSSFSEKLSKRAARDLENLGVQIWTSTQVTAVDKDGVRLGTEVLSASTVLWAAGVQPSSLGKTLGTRLDSVGRVIVQPDLSLEGHPDIFVVGDQAHVQDKQGQS